MRSHIVNVLWATFTNSPSSRQLHSATSDKLSGVSNMCKGCDVACSRDVDAVQWPIGSLLS